MSAQPQPAQPQEKQQVMTEEDADRAFASVIWFYDQIAAGRFVEYEGQFIGICGEQVVAAAPSRPELYQKLDALGDSIKQFQVVVRYIPSGPNDPYFGR